MVQMKSESDTAQSVQKTALFLVLSCGVPCAQGRPGDVFRLEEFPAAAPSDLAVVHLPKYIKALERVGECCAIVDRRVLSYCCAISSAV